MKEIKTQEELKQAQQQKRSVVVFSKSNCIHCSIVQNCIEDIENSYPLINFYRTEVLEMAHDNGIRSYPVLVFYENGVESGRMYGSNHITLIKDILNIWFKKD